MCENVQDKHSEEVGPMDLGGQCLEDVGHSVEQQAGVVYPSYCQSWSPRNVGNVLGQYWWEFEGVG